MSNPNGEKGAETERMAAKYLRAWWPEADRRLREGRRDDQGDLDGVPFTCVQVKYVARHDLQAWVRATLKQRDTKGCPFCLLVVRKKYKAVAAWDAYMPAWHLMDVGLDESEAWTWVRMDLALAVPVLQNLIAEKEGRYVPPSRRSFSTTAST